MKKSIYLLTILLSFVNCSCASLFSSASGVCNCTCEVCKDCKNKHKHLLSPEELAQYEAAQEAKSAEEARRQAELDSLLNMDYSLVKYTIPDLEPYKWEDNEIIKTELNDLSPSFRISGNQCLYSNINTSIKHNDFYMYFDTNNEGSADALHFVVHFYADDSIDFYKMVLNADGFTYEYTPKNLNRSRDGIYYAENFDDVVGDDLKDIVAALAHCEYAHIILISNRGLNHRVVFKPEKLKQFKDTYEIFRLMGGKI